MIFITGDCHGDYRRFSANIFPEQRGMTKEDFVIICGDFGLWDESGEQKYWRKWLSEKPFTTLWVDGNHENYDLLKTYPVECWRGGKVQFITPDIIHLMRGQVYDIEGIRSLDQCGWKVDIIVSHCCASSVQKEVCGEQCESDALTEYFEMIKGRCGFGKWIFGHYHENRNVGERFVVLYEQLVRVVRGVMNYFFDMQNKTFNQEFKGGFLWAPYRTVNNRRNASWELMDEVHNGDVIIHSFHKKIVTSDHMAQLKLLNPRRCMNI